MRKFEIADKNLGLLTKNYLMHWQIRGLKTAYLAIFGLYTQIFKFIFSYLACDNRYTRHILLLVGPQQSLLIVIIK